MAEKKSESVVREIKRSRYLVAHRLEFDLPGGLKLGGSESVVYGDRGIELAYLMPLISFWSAQNLNLGIYQNFNLNGYDTSFLFQDNILRHSNRKEPDRLHLLDLSYQSTHDVQSKLRLMNGDPIKKP